MNSDGQRLYLEFLQTITKNTQDLIESTRPITTGAENIHGVWLMKKQYNQINEEVMESFAEFLHGKSPEDECEEDLDILFSTLALIHKKGYTPMEIKFAVGRLQKKYTERGFLKFE